MMNLPIPILSALIGTVVLLFGRKLFWLCVAAVGFAVGVQLAPHLFHESTAVLALTVALVLGFIGALLALFLQKLAIAVTGFLAGGKLAVSIAAAFFVQLLNYYAITFVVGGIIGALLLLALFDWALIFVSSIVGAYLIQSAITLPPVGGAVLFVVLAAVGVFIQGAAMQRSASTIT
jgi:Domain of unknown function (DUF4203)